MEGQRSGSAAQEIVAIDAEGPAGHRFGTDITPHFVWWDVGEAPVGLSDYKQVARPLGSRSQRGALDP